MRGTPPDAPAAAASLARFLDLCPERLADVAFYQRRVGTLDFWQQRLAAFRQQPAALHSWHDLPKIWELSFAVAPPAEHEVLRQEIRKDLARVRSATDADEPERWRVVHRGAQLVDDEPADREALDALIRLEPCGLEAEEAWHERWEASHPRPSLGA
ncbi:MAG TPA: hypothetical protein VGV61_17455, partial [Thermoanaerobaculia bacterium]|nr:hypothetical protein [Thermoanaerobaculia bacterium]